ncbi:DUF5067 domain-containing protein [Anaerotignum sp.]|uniref:DUF5067 domain-containing protein n=1 Tax=Anaerotignum sp. TaxID=2039241 RepID=UPI003734ED83
MKRGKQLLGMFVAALMVCSFAACGKEPEETATDDNPKNVKFELGDYELLYKDSCIMTDYAGGDALVMKLDYTNNSSSSDSYLWSISETVVQNESELLYATIFLSEDSFESVGDSQMYSIEPGETIEIQTAFVLEDTTNPVEVTFEESWGDAVSETLTIDPSKLKRETPKAPEGTTNTATAEKTASVSTGDPLLDWWNGEWYGWWIMTSCYGVYEDMENMSWDLCGVIDIGEDYTGTVTLWDEDYERYDPMVEASVSLNEAGTGEYGTLMSEGGSFTDVPLEHADWIIDPALDEFPGRLHIDGSYENGEDRYNYDIYMLPWGDVWQLGEDFLPYGYYDWYLPLIEAGQPMPDSIDIVG